MPDQNPPPDPISRALFARGTKVIPGGVNSPVRAYKAVGGCPPFLRIGSGCRVQDEDGRSFLDYVGSWGPHLFGHGDPDVIAAVRDAVLRGTSFGAPTEAEVELAELIVEMVPSVEKVRLVNSGTEAAMSAVRVARGVRGCDKVIKFEGCYHGHADGFLIQAGSGPATFGVPSSPGVPAGTAMDTLSARFNDLESVEALFDRYPGEISAVIVEPVAGNMGCVPPTPGFLAGLRAICDREESLLLFDEVITGFRLAPGGAQEVYRVRPDLTVLGKVVGGGLPLAAYGGRADLMDQIAPEGPIYQAGTLSGNPLATAAGLAVLRKIKKAPEVYQRLEELGRRLEDGSRAIQQELSLDLGQTRAGSMFTLFFAQGPIRSWSEVKQADTARFKKYFHGMLARKIYLPPSQFETLFISAAHGEREIDETLEAMRDSLREAFA